DSRINLCTGTVRACLDDLAAHCSGAEQGQQQGCRSHPHGVSPPLPVEAVVPQGLARCPVPAGQVGGLWLWSRQTIKTLGWRLVMGKGIAVHLVGVLSLVLAASVQAADSKWYEYQSDNFTLHTDLNEVAARRMLSDFETFRKGVLYSLNFPDTDRKSTR